MPMPAPTDILSLLADNGVRLLPNLSVPALMKATLRRGEARLAATGAITATTGKYTGRSPGDKFLVDDAETHSRVDWGKTNQPLPPEKFRCAFCAKWRTFAAGR